MFSVMSAISLIYLTTNCKHALQNAHCGVNQKSFFWCEERLRLQKTLECISSSLPEKRITRILFCEMLPEAEFLCYGKIITNANTASQQNRDFAGRV